MNPNNWKNPGIKIPYLDITDKPIVEGTRCVEVRIPDDDAYMPVLAGLVALATKWFNWQRDEAHRGTQIAKLWQLAYIETDWGSCMNCEELIACLQPVLDAQAAQIINQVTTNITNFQQFGTGTPGAPMTQEQLETNLAEGTNPSCNLNVLWAQSLAVVQYTNRFIQDLFERIEAATNAIELTEIFTDLPIVTWISDTFGVEFAEGLINYYQEAVAEGYIAEYTQSVEEQLACAVFCDANVDCTITVDLLYNIFYSRVQAIVPDDPIDAIQLLTLLAGIDITTSTVVDLMFWFVWGSAKLMTFFVDKAIVNLFTLQQLMSLAVDDASTDWQLLCDCPEDCVDTDDLRTGENGWNSGIRNPSFNATYVPGDGYDKTSASPTPNSIPFEIWKAFAASTLIKLIEFDYTLTAVGSTNTGVSFADAAEGAAGTVITSEDPALTVGSHTWTSAPLNYTIVNGGIRFSTDIDLVAPGNSLTVHEIRVTYEC